MFACDFGWFLFTCRCSDCSRLAFCWLYCLLLFVCLYDDLVFWVGLGVAYYCLFVLLCFVSWCFLDGLYCYCASLYVGDCIVICCFDFALDVFYLVCLGCVLIVLWLRIFDMCMSIACYLICYCVWRLLVVWWVVYIVAYLCECLFDKLLFVVYLFACAWLFVSFWLLLVFICLMLRDVVLLYVFWFADVCGCLVIWVAICVVCVFVCVMLLFVELIVNWLWLFLLLRLGLVLCR